VHFYYESHVRPSMTPLSLSLPLENRGRFDVSDWVDGLLPENHRTRARMARELGAPSTAPYDLLCTQAGLECAGAVQFWPRPTLDDPQMDELVKLNKNEIAERLRLLSRDADGDPSDGLADLRLSLAGAQPKMALSLIENQWHLPGGSLATTHILKPQSGHLNERLRDSIAVNEHLCQTVATMLGFNAAHTSLELFGDEACLVVERFDRDVSGNEVRRLHFEDLCAALGVPSAQKYQEDGGPSPEDIIALLRQESRGDARLFFLSLFYSWLIGNTDGHAKNYGLLWDGPQAMLAPLYDLNSLAPYLIAEARQTRQAMVFAETNPVTLEEWVQTASRLGLSVGIDKLRNVTEALPNAFEAATAQCPQWAMDTAHKISGSIVAYAEAK